MAHGNELNAWNWLWCDNDIVLCVSLQAQKIRPKRRWAHLFTLSLFKEVSGVTLSLSHQRFRIIIQRGTSEVGHLSFCKQRQLLPKNQRNLHRLFSFLEFQLPTSASQGLHVDTLRRQRKLLHTGGLSNSLLADRALGTQPRGFSIINLHEKSSMQCFFHLLLRNLSVLNDECTNRLFKTSATSIPFHEVLSSKFLLYTCGWWMWAWMTSFLLATKPLFSAFFRREKIGGKGQICGEKQPKWFWKSGRMWCGRASFNVQ